MKNYDYYQEVGHYKFQNSLQTVGMTLTILLLNFVVAFLICVQPFTEESKLDWPKKETAELIESPSQMKGLHEDTAQLLTFY